MKPEAPIAFDAALAELREKLPGWWYRVGDCSVSCDATVGPDAAYVLEPHLSLFDAGFDCDARQPSTTGEALHGAIELALAAIEIQKNAETAEANEAAELYDRKHRRQHIMALRGLAKQPAVQLVTNKIDMLEHFKQRGWARAVRTYHNRDGRVELVEITDAGLAALTASKATQP